MIMKIHFPLLICLITIFLLSCGDDEPVWPQLFTNPNVEDGVSWPTGWGNIEVDGAGLEFEWKDDEAFSGTKSLSIVNATSDSLIWGYWYQIYEGDMPVGEDILLSVKIKGVDIQGSGVGVAIRADDLEIPASEWQFSTTGGTERINGTFDWKDYNVVIEDLIPGVDRIFVFLMIYPNSKGEVFFDDINLRVLD